MKYKPTPWKSKSFTIMAQSLAKIYIHLIFHIKTMSPKIRENDLERLHNYIGKLVKTTGCAEIINKLCNTFSVGFQLFSISFSSLFLLLDDSFLTVFQWSLEYIFEPDYADSMFNFNLSVKIYRSIDYQKKQKNNK